MADNKIINNEKNELLFNQLTIVDMKQVDNFLFIVLSNDQKIIISDNKIYDVSGYSQLISVFTMNKKLCAVLTKGSAVCLIDLNTMKELFNDINAYHISKQDERTIHVIMKIGGGNTTLYDIETKKYLPVPTDYEYEKTLGNNLYVFSEELKLDKDFYDKKRCVVNADGKIILENIEGVINIFDNRIIIKKRNEIRILNVNVDSVLDINTLKQQDNMIAMPDYYDGNIIIMEKGIIKIYTVDLELIKEIMVDELEAVLDYEIISDILKLCIPYTKNGKQINKQLLVNLRTDKLISHIRIDPYPYWNPTTYIGQDGLDSDLSDFHFYNLDFELMNKVSANYYEDVDGNKENMFLLTSTKNDCETKQLLNASNGSVKEVDYDYIQFPYFSPYGYGVRLSTKTMDFFDEKLNVVIPNFNYEQYRLDFRKYGFHYFIVNDYICINKHYVDGYGQSRYRTILQKSTGEIIVDSITERCSVLGNYIQIADDNETKYLNTQNGKIGPLLISSSTNEFGKINFSEIKNVNDLFRIGNNDQLTRMRRLEANSKLDDDL